MRVLVVSNMYPTAEEPWFGSFVRDQVDDVRALGLDVDVFHFDGRRDRRAYLRAIRGLRPRVHGREVVYDVVHAHYGLTGAAAALALPSVPLVTTFHGSDYGGPPWQRVVSSAVARRSAAIVVSEAGRGRLRAGHAAVVPMGVDTTRFSPADRREARRALGWDEERRYALLAGSRTNPVKRGDVFDAAVAVARERVPELRGMELAGYGRDEVAVVLNAADVVVLCSDNEGSPLTIREALACATPVVSVDVGDAAHVLRGLAGCPLVDRDPVALAGGIVTALDAGRPPELRERAEETSRTVVAAAVADVYRKLAREAG